MIFRYKKKYVDHKEDGNAFSCPCKKKNKKSLRGNLTGELIDEL